MNKFDADFAFRLKHARKLSKKNQVQVYESTGINNKTLSGYERGISQPKLEDLCKLADCYGVTLDWLCGRKEGW